MSARRSLTTGPAPKLERGDDWRDQSACLDVEPELFYPPGSTWARHKDRAEQAKTICRACPVRQQCLAGALARPFDAFAILGATTPGERKHLKTEPRATVACDTCGREFKSTSGLAAHAPTHNGPTCKRNHDIRQVGRYADGSCKECRREQKRKRAAA